MRKRIRDELVFLYGEAAGRDAASRVDALLKRFRAQTPVNRLPNREDRLTERDALLITYADQVREPGRAPLQVLRDFACAHLRGLVTGLHLLPFYPWSSDDGFSVKDYFAVEPAYGTWDDVARIGEDFDLMFDAVFNHLSAQSDWFQRFLRGESAFREFFIVVEGNPDLSQVIRPRALPLLTEFPTPVGPKKVWTTFSADQVDLNFRCPAVLLAVVEALLLYVARGVRFIRLDAIAFLWKEPGTSCLHLPQTHSIVRLLRAVLDEVAPHVRLITETNVPHAENVSYFGDGTNEAHLVYNFALPPLVLHALRTGNADPLTGWARSLETPSSQVTFFNFLASHDGIGLNPVRGILSDADLNALVAHTLECGGFISFKDMPDGSRWPYEMNINYLDALSNPADQEPVEWMARKFLTAQAILLSLQGVPGIYFHSLFGSRGDRAGAQSSGIPRRINRQKLERGPLEAALADPASLRARVFAGYSALLRTRRAHRAFAPASPQRVLELDPRVFALLRETADRKDCVLCLHNLSAEPVACVLPQRAIPPGPWRDLLERPGASRGDLTALPAGAKRSATEVASCGAARPASDRMQLGPWETRWLSIQPSG